jgi:hypothetical protein
VNSWTYDSGQSGNLDLHIIRYEDLLSKPSEQLPKLASLLGVLAEANEIARVIEATSVDQMRIKEQNGMPDHEISDTFEFIGPAKPKQWVNCLSTEQLDLLDKYFGETMKRYGYV